jgi:hypothetical protein
MTNDSLSSVVIWRPSSQRKKERKREILCFVGEREILFFQKREKTFD